MFLLACAPTQIKRRMADRYFSNEPITGDQVVLAGTEAHHLLHVMRSKVGQQVVVFDGSGVEWVARVEKLTRREVELTILERVAVDRELSIGLTLGVAL